MAPIVALGVFLLLLYTARVQSSAPPVFVQKGKDVTLDVDNVPEDFSLLVWKFDKNGSNLVRFSPGDKQKITKAYTGRIDFSEKKKYSVILKNLQESDSGVYIARVTTDDDHILVKHNIIVQDVVSPVQLEVNSVSNSSDSCNVTVTCSTADSHISSTFRCVNQTCDQNGGNQSKSSDSSSTLQVHLSNVTVICEHSNQVSSAENRTDIQHLCSHGTVAQSNRIHKDIAIGVSVSLLFAAVVGILAAYRRRKNPDVKEESTVYEMVETTKAPDVVPNSDEASGLCPVSEYSLVGPHTVSSAADETRDKPHPESLYAQVEKCPRA